MIDAECNESVVIQKIEQVAKSPTREQPNIYSTCPRFALSYIQRIR